MSLSKFLSQINRPDPLSHKGNNGRALIVGGSDLFHAASQWSFKAASRFVDMTFYCSTSENNDLVRDAKFYGADGVVVRRSDLPSYLDEVDAILIGPGMRRDVSSRFSAEQLETISVGDLNQADWESDTTAVVSALLRSWPQKRWIIDAGALQVMQPSWTPPGSILTPHPAEMHRWLAKEHPLSNREISLPLWDNHDQQIDQLRQISTNHGNSVFLLKGPVDLIWDNEQVVTTVGGNAGMTKGGTGDVLAGVVLGFRAGSPAFASAAVSSWLNKQAGHRLYSEQAEMYNASDLVDEIPRAWAELVSE